MNRIKRTSPNRKSSDHKISEGGDSKANFKETVQLPFELTNGNDGRGSKWFNSAKLRKQFEADLIKLGFSRSPYLFPVKVTVTRVLGKGQRLWDYDSIGRGNAKEIFDSMVACGWFVDDSPKFISGVSYDQDSSRRNQGPFVEMEITQSGPFFEK